MRNNLLFSVAFGLVVALPLPSFAGPGHSPKSQPTPLIMRNDGVQNTIQGTVSDSNGPLAGVTVSVIGGNTVVATDSNGKFSINAERGATLRFSFIGYESKDLLVSASTMNVVLQPD
jgi:hypothetical protein